MENENNLEKQVEKIESIDIPLHSAPVFPMIAMIPKLIASSICSANEMNFLSTYLTISVISDMVETCYRVYGKKEVGPIIPLFHYNKEEEERAQEKWDANREEHMSLAKPYSCFEKHIFYDLPKYLYKKIKERKWTSRF